METYLMILIAIVATGGVILLIASTGLLIWGLWRHWFVEPSRSKTAQSSGSPAAPSEAAQQ